MPCPQGITSTTLAQCYSARAKPGSSILNSTIPLPLHPCGLGSHTLPCALQEPMLGAGFALSIDQGHLVISDSEGLNFFFSPTQYSELLRRPNFENETNEKESFFATVK